MGADENVGPLGLAEDLDPVAEGTCAREGPACAAVDGDVLVALDREVVDTTDVSPPKSLRNFRLIKLWQRILDHLGAVGVVLETTQLYVLFQVVDCARGLNGKH